MSALKDLGIDGENLAAKHLESLGYSILGRNFRHRLGEIDVAEYEGLLVVYGVKPSSNDKIDPSLSVTLAKRTKLRKLYEVFITGHPNKLKMKPRFAYFPKKRCSRVGAYFQCLLKEKNGTP